jgi:hypothetical protein
MRGRRERSDMKTIDEVLEVTSQVLIRCTVMGVVALLLWWGVLELWGDLAYGVHSKMAPMSKQQFDIIHYVGILTTKAAVSLLFFFPFIAIRLVIKKRKRQSSNQALEATS